MRFLSIIIFILGFSVVAAAQESVLTGKVLDRNKKGIPDVQVSAIYNDESSKILERIETVSDTDGNYAIKLRQGQYTLEFFAKGFKRTKVERFQVGLAEKMSFDTSLEVGGFICGLPLLSLGKINLIGTVIDEFDAVVPNSKVELKLNTKGTFETYTDENGEFAIEIPKGTYRISISAESFKKTVLKNQVIYSDSKRLTFKLKSNIQPHQIT